MITTHTRRMLECSTCHVLKDAKTGFTKNERKQYDCAETPPPVAAATTTGGQRWTPPPPPPVNSVGRRKTITCRTCRRIHGQKYVPPPASAMIIPLYAPKPPVGGAYHYFNGEYYLETGKPTPKQQYPSHHPGHTNYNYHHQQYHHPNNVSSGNNTGWNNSTGSNPQNHHSTQNNTFATTTMPNQIGGSDGGGGGWNAATIKLRQHSA